jgi:hypothetical protein
VQYIFRRAVFKRSLKKTVRQLKKSEEKEALLALPTAAKQQFQTTVNENQKLRRCLNGQCVIIDAMERALPEGDSVSELIDAIESQLSSVTKHIRSAILSLAQPHMAQSPDAPTRSAAPVLEAAMQKAQKMLLARSKEAIRSRRDSVPLTEVFEIEDSNTDELIHETQRNRTYPETEQEQAERNKVIEEHNKKVVGYLH